MMKKLAAVVLLSVFIFSGCGSSSSSSSSPSSEPGPFKSGEFGRINLKDNKYDTLGVNDGAKVLDGGILIDIRNKWERENGQAVEANPAIIVYEYRNQANPNDRKLRETEFLKEVTDLVKNDKNKKIVLICHSGSRSVNAAKLLSQNGFTNVYDILGGFVEWENHFNTNVYTN